MAGRPQYTLRTKMAALANGQLRHNSGRAESPRAQRTGVGTSGAVPVTCGMLKNRGMASAKQIVEVEGQPVALTNLDKALYPGGFTKAQVIDYYIRIAPLLLPHFANRPVTLHRFPDGITGQS